MTSQLIDPQFNPDRQGTYNLMAAYFDNPLMELVSPHTYMVRVNTRMMEDRYLVVIANANKPQARLSELQWESLQTRVLTRPPRVQLTTAHAPKQEQYAIELHVEHRDTLSTTYGGPGLRVAVLHKYESLYEYPNRNMLNSLLETYRCVVSF